MMVTALMVAALTMLVLTVGGVVVAALMVAVLMKLLLTMGLVVVVVGCRLDVAEYHQKIMFHQNCSHIN